jgi:periplasmic protein TonB
MWVALGGSLLFHAIVLLIHFDYPDASVLKSMSQPLEVVLVNSKSANRPVKPTALAQVDLDGGGNTEQALRAKTNLPALADMPADAELELSARRVQQLEQEARRLMAKLEAEGSAVNPNTQPVEQVVQADLDSMTDLSSEALKVARLEAEIARQWQAYQELPKRRFVGARTQGVAYAEYVDDWRQKIERVGTSNFPPEARERSVFGTVLVTVAIKADGSVEKVEIDRSSGSALLDQAVERIVRLASPFQPFPAHVRRDTDILHITRNWSFTRSDLLLQ